MPVVVHTNPSAEPVSLADAKEHLRVVDTADNAYITSLIAVARRAIEIQIHRKLITQTLTLTLNEFPCDRIIHLEFATPLQSVTHVKYLDVNGDEQTLDPDSYLVRTQFTPGHIFLKSDQSWPSTYVDGAAVTIQYVVGYGNAGSDVPSDIVHAIKILVGHYYANRELNVTGTIVAELPRTVDALVMPYKVWS